MMRIEQFEYLLAVSEIGSINKASKSLHTSPQNISKSLKQLENDLGVPLFETCRQGTIFTPQGEEAVILAQTILDLIRKFKAKNVISPDQPEGNIYIAASRMPSLCFLSNLLFQFSDIYPKIKVSFTETDVLKVFELINQDPRYLGFASCLVNEQVSTIPKQYDDIFDLTPLQEDHIIALVQKDSALSRQKSISFLHLAKQKLGVLINNDNGSESFFHQVMKQYHCESNITFTTGNSSLYYKGIIEGRFVAASSLNTFATYDPYYKEKMAVLSIRDNSLFTNDLVLRKNTLYDSASQCFIDFIKEAILTK